GLFLCGGAILARIYPLFSSSKGNATFVGTPSAGVLIDAGVTYKRLNEGLLRCGLTVDAVKAVFVTHEHSDHVKGISVLTKAKKIPVYAQKITLENLISQGIIHSEGFEIRGVVEICGMKISAFETPHDTEQSCGYQIITLDNRKCAVCTDLGHVTATVDENLCGCDLVLLEANYDEKMLRNGCYPEYLKSRISSQNGHLSNNDCANYVKKLIEKGTTRVILGHLSQENNSPKAAENAVFLKLSQYVRNIDYILQVAPVETSGECVAF
ncbi:MAG: MBL fold metallo-hydrolase, partial [Oscillospiraceae bacterium]